MWTSFVDRVLMYQLVLVRLSYAVLKVYWNTKILDRTFSHVNILQGRADIRKNLAWPMTNIELIDQSSFRASILVCKISILGLLMGAILRFGAAW